MSDIPKFVYKIIPEAPPLPLPRELLLSSLDAKDGFIHLSIAARIPATADLFFDQQSTMWLLKVDKQVVENEGGRLVWVENVPGAVHLYGQGSKGWDGARLGEGTIVGSRRVERSENQTWSEAIAEDGWLVDE